MTRDIQNLPEQTGQVQMLSGMHALVNARPDRFDGFICDVWGVLHDGVAPYPGVQECLRQLRALGQPVILLSNAPRPAPSVARQLAALGYEAGPDGHYDRLITSGDATRTAIASGYYGVSLLHIGPDRDLPLFDGLDIECGNISNSQFALCTGLYDDEREGPDDYRKLLRDLLARELPMLCANPDDVVMRGGKLIYCAGAVARAYAAIGGAVTFFGKPYPGVYRLCLDALGEILGRPVPAPRVLAIGDGLFTDISGAQAAGMPTLFLSGGIHAEELGGVSGPPESVLPALIQACAKAKIRLPTAVIYRLVW
ncbi:MAG: TIGR01459 family HAD-type hydrolase [Alphaproteobacteria bacterium]